MRIPLHSRPLLLSSAAPPASFLLCSLPFLFFLSLELFLSFFFLLPHFILPPQTDAPSDPRTPSSQRDDKKSLRNLVDMKPSILLRALLYGLFVMIFFNVYLFYLLHQYRDETNESRVLFQEGEINPFHEDEDGNNDRSFVNVSLRTNRSDDSEKDPRTITVQVPRTGNDGYATPASLSRDETMAAKKPNGAKAFAKTTTTQQKSRHKASLVCDSYGGPSEERAAEMVYWWDIPSDQYFPSAFSNSSAAGQKYLTFEPDKAGFNNVRIAFELAVVLAHAMGRTLVIPPKSTFWNMPGKSVSIPDFFEFDLRGLPVVSFESFLRQEALAGNLYDHNGSATYPPDNRTNWDGRIGVYSENDQRLWEWMRSTATMLDWTPKCVVVFPSNSTLGVPPPVLNEILREREQEGGREDLKYSGRPTPVNASMIDRLREMLVGRNKLCGYNKELQDAKVIHLPGREETGHRLLVPFYALVFFEKWQADIRMKRLVRDHLRYADEIQCAAARIVSSMRETELKSGRDGTFDSLHLRRKDFTKSFASVSSTSEDILAGHFLRENRTVYVATDETNASWFDPFRKYNRFYFLDNFTHLMEGVDPNLFGLIEQLVVARGDAFVGTYYSTFSGKSCIAFLCVTWSAGF